MTALLAAAALAVACVDWWSVWAERSRVEQIAKPLVMVALIVLALQIDAEPAVARWLVIAGFGFGLLGDLALLPRYDKFLPGLAAFLVGHLFYAAAFATMELAFIGIVGGMSAAVVIIGYLGTPTMRRVRGGPYIWPVVGYMGVIALLLTFGTATHRWPIAIGGVLFAISDGLLGLDRFVRPLPQFRWLVHMLYHLAQTGIVLGLSHPSNW